MPPKRRASRSEHDSYKRARPKPGWSSQDQTILEATTAQEITLWKRFHRQFNDTPFNVLQGLIIATDPDKKLKDHDGESTIANTNWSKAFCEELNHLVCVPFFQDHPGLLRYAMKRARWARVGGEKPEMKEIIPTRNKDFVDKLITGVVGLVEDEDVVEFITKATTEAFGTGKPIHSGFLSYIDHASADQSKARGRHAQASGISVGDISTIIRAWDTYATLRDNMVELKVVADYFEIAKGIRDGPSKEEILKLKKEWIIKSRRSDYESSGSSPQETPGTIIPDSQTDARISRPARPSTTPAGPPGRLSTTPGPIIPDSQTDARSPRPAGPSTTSASCLVQYPLRVPVNQLDHQVPLRVPVRPAPPSPSGHPLTRPSNTPSGSSPPSPKSPLMPVPRRNRGTYRRGQNPSGRNSNSTTYGSSGLSTSDYPAPSGLPQPNTSSGQASVPVSSEQASQVGTDLPCLDGWVGQPLESSRHDQIQVPLDFNRVRLAYWPIKLTREDKDDFGKTPFDRNWHLAPENYQKGIDLAAESWLAGKLPAGRTRIAAFSKYTPVSIDYPRPLEGVPAGGKVGMVEWKGPPLDPCI